MRKNSLFSPSAASYLVFILIGICLLYSSLNPLDTIGEKLPVLQALNLPQVTLLAQFYMIIGIVGLVLNLVLSLARVNLFAFLCILIDAEYIGLHLYLMKDAENGIKILFIFFIILSIISFVSNITSFKAK